MVSITRTGDTKAGQGQFSISPVCSVGFRGGGSVARVVFVAAANPGYATDR